MDANYDDLLRRLRVLERKLEKSSIADRAAPVVARAETAAPLSIPNTTATIVQYDTVNYDPLGTITIGAAWKFTAPLTGYYRIQAAASLQSTLTWATGETASLRFFKNGILQSLLDYNDSMNSAAVAQVKWLAGGDIVSLATGEYIDIRMVQFSGAALTLHPFAVHNYIAISKIN